MPLHALTCPLTTYLAVLSLVCHTQDNLSYPALSLCGHMLSAIGHCTIAAVSPCAIADLALWWCCLLG